MTNFEHLLSRGFQASMIEKIDVCHPVHSKENGKRPAQQENHFFFAFQCDHKSTVETLVDSSNLMQLRGLFLTLLVAI